MNRLILIGLGIVSLVGFALGWTLLGRPEAAPANPSIPAPAAKTLTFALLPADVRVDRETPAIAADAQGNVFLAWASQTADMERTIVFARSSDARAATSRRVSPVPVTSRCGGGKDRGFSTSVLPRLVTAGDAIYLGWTEAIDGGPRVDYRIARSTDAGKTFGDPVRVHGDNASRPGFIALAAGHGRLVSAWLDGRNHAQQPFAAVANASGAFTPETLVYAGEEKGVCPCCDVAAARSADGTTLVALRDSASGYRDIVVARANGSRYDPPVPVSAEHWTFQGCPHDGPSLAIAAERVHVAWMDAHAGKRRVYIAESPLAKLAFQARELAPDRPGEQAHPRLVTGSDGTLHAVWDEGTEQPQPKPGEHMHGAPAPGATRAIVHAVSRDNGKTFTNARVVAPNAHAFQTQPGIAMGPTGTVYFAWCELTTEGKRVVFATSAE